jgi:CRISPR-associated protein Cas6
MYWEEEKKDTPEVVPDDVVDVSFAISCRHLPVDHAYALFAALQQVLPWFADQPLAGLHLIHGAESGNGWYRPEDPQALLLLSRRARLSLRLPKHRVEDATALCSRTLDIAGQALQIGEHSVRPLSTITTLYARHVVHREEQDEEAFLSESVDQLRALGIQFKKVLPGRAHRMASADGCVHTRSLMVADLSPDDSLKLQRHGLGPLRTMGCGLFIPHKAIRNVYAG